MREIRLSAKAERDLIDIWHYGYRRWGETKAGRYLHRIDKALQRLRLHPGVGVDSSTVMAGFRRWRVGEHHIYYEVDDQHLYVVRILGSRQDAPARLRE